MRGSDGEAERIKKMIRQLSPDRKSKLVTYLKQMTKEEKERGKGEKKR